MLDDICVLVDFLFCFDFCLRTVFFLMLDTLDALQNMESSGEENPRKTDHSNWLQMSFMSCFPGQLQVYSYQKYHWEMFLPNFTYL